jgi:hypothetical protein
VGNVFAHDVPLMHARRGGREVASGFFKRKQRRRTRGQREKEENETEIGKKLGEEVKTEEGKAGE